MSNQTIKLNEHGNIDIDYYTRLASQQRSEYIALKAAALTAKVKSLFRKSFLAEKLPTLSASH
ncbi:RSP_7527 family protein [Marinobacter confluentis]|uniref:Uncharacterized protein n=1 Tax=Marinobacter confluentis TaxID=1697557 RepID=A0A4Z1C4V2_9GAMM|nr:hypothetical protein [Marinobacter confluentis]TGN40300.1 hypothetical protein E5Q11_08450 [Marinobacter confluentis]